MSRYKGTTYSRLKAISAEVDTLTVAPVSATAATLTVTAASHAGKTIVLNRAAGVAVTLPAATGSGNAYHFSVGTAVTSNANTIKVADATDVMGGAIVVGSVTDGSATAFATQATSDTISMNGTTTGGLVGGLVTLVDIAANVYAVSGSLSGSGSEATPFSATVS